MWLYIIISMLSFMYWDCAAQEALPDSSFTLPQQLVTANKISSFALGSKMWKPDSALTPFFETSGLQTLLNYGSAAVIRNYSPGGLAAITIRGLSSQHTALVWNGMAIQNPMNGFAEPALLGSFFADEVVINFAIQSTLHNIANLGASIQLINNPEFDKGLKVKYTASVGMFGTVGNVVYLGWSNKRWYSSVKYRHFAAQNNYPYRQYTLPGNELKTLRNAGIFQQGGLYALHGKIAARQMISFYYWVNGSDRKIPAPLTAQAGAARQYDQSHRALVVWKYTGAKMTMESKTALLTEKLRYTDTTLALNARSKSSQFVTETALTLQPKPQWLISMGINNTLQTALTDNYKEIAKQNLLTAYGAVKGVLLSGKMEASASIRQGLANSRFLPLAASTGLQFTLSKHLKLLAMTSKNYRLPTFNDLYWQPGGNAALLPENGWQQEIGLQAIGNIAGMVNLHANFTLHSNRVTNWIQWLPIEQNSNVWQPVNHTRVWSRGLETGLQASYSRNNLTLNLKINYQYQLTTNQLKGKSKYQFIYVPYHTAQNNLMLTYKNTGLAWQQNYTGKRFTTTDNSRFLLPFWLSHLIATQQFTIGAVKLTTSVNIHNIFGVSYELVEYRPLPKRYAEVQLSLAWL